MTISNIISDEYVSSLETKVIDKTFCDDLLMSFMMLLSFSSLISMLKLRQTQVVTKIVIWSHIRPYSVAKVSSVTSKTSQMIIFLVVMSIQSLYETTLVLR
jgi:hypothetical protein